MSNQINKTQSNVPATLKYIEETLRELGIFYFWPNDGNLGDNLIAEATRQIFRQAGLSWLPYNPESPPKDSGYVLVYGGGGRFVPHWGGIELHLKHMTRPEVRRCVILPHSIYGVDHFVKGLDERHIIFCREHKTLEYCRNLNTKSQFILAHDLGVSLKLNEIKIPTSLPSPAQNATSEEAWQYNLLTGNAARDAYSRVREATVKSPKSGRNIAFFLRQDREKSIALTSPWSYDLSGLWSGTCNETAYSSSLLKLMAELASYPDVVVTDRLHVAIMAMHVGKEVYMLDNDYGKLSGVYEVSLKEMPQVHLLQPGKQWPEELSSAWRRLNPPLRRMIHYIRTKLSPIKRKLKKFLRIS